MTVVLPFFATGTMERVEKLGQIATASTLARIFSIIPYACEGPTQLCIFDIHALQEQFYFSDNVKIRLKSCIYLLRNRIQQLPEESLKRISFFYIFVSLFIYFS